jgi:hypothetical protein
LPELLRSALRLPVVRPAVGMERLSGDDWAFRFAEGVAAAIAQQLDPVISSWAPVRAASG